MKKVKFQSTPNPSFSTPVDQLLPNTEGRKNFLRKVENFKCENCGEEVVGNGYTDHCPKCLWGKHVDEEIPGDRASECRGLMKPIEVAYLSGKFKIHYRCSKCRHEFWVWAAEGDNKDLLMELVRG
ncbi:MAG: RNHCP domain-containing protein [Candidatus Shapirobacteria bacterium]|jgi:hypothetical protein